jgi:gliding motility-associated lipoprotein GldH
VPGDTIKHQRLDLPLGTDGKGWEGTGLDDIWELRKPITSGPMKFKKPGNYSFFVQHIMRENPLDNIMSIGVRIEKAK